MSDDFYKSFEEKYRGSRVLIKSRLRVYLPFIEPLLSLYKDAKAIDLGCGRGEWLELLKESGFNGHGVDLDDGMLEACRGLGLSVDTQDAISALKALPDESQTIVSGFHLAEHIQFSDLQVLAQEALRVLKPAGLLILETPNPENITVGTVNFYLDPTHQRPIPPQLLSFLPEYYGFAAVKVIRLQEDESLVGKSRTSLSDVLVGVSPDYAVVAQKSADIPLLDYTSDAFAREYGLTLDVLVAKFDHEALQASERAVLAEVQAKQASERAASAEAQVQQASELAIFAEAQAQQASELAVLAEAQAQQASERAASAEVKAQQAEALGQRVLASENLAIDILNSTSWRITAPLRMIGHAAKSIILRPRAVKSKIKEKINLFLAHARHYVNRRPRLRRFALAILAKLPYLERYRYIKQKTFLPTDLENMSPRVHHIHAELKAAMEELSKDRC